MLMKHQAKLRKVGGSVMLTIPPAVLDELDLAADARVGVAVKRGRLIVEPVARPRYSLDELLSEARAVPRGAKTASGLPAKRRAVS